MLNLTVAQQDIYLEGKFFGQVINNIGGYQKYPCRLDVPRFQRARELLLQGNDAYRLRFRETGGECVPFVSDNLPSSLRMIDCPTEASALAWIQEQFETPFEDISTDVFQDALVRLSPDEYWYFAKAHHLVMDGWGFALQMQRFLWLYEQLAQPDEEAEPARTPYPSFVDYMRRQSDYRDSAQYRQSRDYWLTRHDGAFGVLFAPTSGTQASGLSGRVSIALEAGLMEALKRLAAEAEVNLVTVIYAALYVYFTRAYQRGDLTIGSPMHNRRNALDKDVIGSIVNVNAHRFAVPADSSFPELLVHIVAAQKQDYRHSRFPLGDLVRALREERGATGEPPYEVAFNYQKLDFQLSIHGREVETHYLSHSHERVPLTFVLCEYGEGRDVWLHLDYSKAYFDQAQAAPLLDRLAGLMRQISEDFTRRIDAYDLLTPAERRDQLVAWQGARFPLEEELCIHEFFERQALRTPDRVAVTCGDAAVTYAELNQRANRLARELIRLGAGPGNLIGICHDRSPHLLAAMLAVLKSGSTYVPIDPSYPQARVQYILDDSRLAIVVADARGVAALGGRACAVIDPSILLAEPFPAGEICPNPTRTETGLSAGDLAYVIYTSGSTGRPKGVLIEHRNTAAFIQWALGHFSAVELSVVLAATSICFDLSIFELFVPLAAGGRVVLVENVLALKQGGMDDLSLINTVPSAIRGLLEAKAIPSSVRCINLAGELLRQDLVDALYELGTQKVYDLYGPSEDTTYSTVCLRTKGGEPSIGRPIANTEVYVLDAAGNLLPSGMVGELYLGGAGVAKGYLNQAALTAEKFVFSRHTHARLYRTGDLVRFTADGQLQYMGRKDSQVKIRGYRIEPGEIEACLLECPMVADCVVVSSETTTHAGHKSLVAYVVGAGFTDGEEVDAPGELSMKALGEFVAERLPAYMMPSQFVILPALPLTPNGKIDRAALPVPGEIIRREEAVYALPSNDIEQRLCNVWQATLKQERIGIHDSFFARGGDSLLLVKLASAIEGEFDLRVDLPLLFANLTIETQAKFLGQQLELMQLLRAVSLTGEARPNNYVEL